MYVVFVSICQMKTLFDSWSTHVQSIDQIFNGIMFIVFTDENMIKR
jgi:hypothetical protein